MKTMTKTEEIVYNEKLAEDFRSAVYFDNTEIEVCDEAVLNQLGHIKHAVFDHDGTISTMREGWEEIMEPMMMQAILGDQLHTVDAEAYQTVVAEVKAFINRTTGIQTFYQMEGLIKLVESFGYVPAEEILGPFGYKAIYNDELMNMVNRRMEKLENGELAPDDFIVKGAVEFLLALRDRGVTLYLASGTDVDDVRAEARVLGYEDLFNGGIHGAMRDVSAFSKKMVIEKIIKVKELAGRELAVFGDGPVEMREGRRNGGITVGLASNELRRFGLNLEKRPRLVKAGARLLVPDLSQHQTLIKLLFGEPY